MQRPHLSQFSQLPPDKQDGVPPTSDSVIHSGGENPQAGCVFISYAKEDYEYAHRITRTLQKAGLNVWIDDKKIQPGADWLETIFNAIDSCGAFILIMTPAARESKWVKREYVYASDERKKPIFPILREGSVFPYCLERQYFDAKQGEGLPDKRFVDQIKKAIGSSPNTTEPDPITPASFSSPAPPTPGNGRTRGRRQWLFLGAAFVSAILVIMAILLTSGNGDHQSSTSLTTPSPTPTATITAPAKAPATPPAFPPETYTQEPISATRAYFLTQQAVMHTQTAIIQQQTFDACTATRAYRLTQLANMYTETAAAQTLTLLAPPSTETATHQPAIYQQEQAFIGTPPPP